MSNYAFICIYIYIPTHHDDGFVQCLQVKQQFEDGAQYILLYQLIIAANCATYR